MQKVRKISKDKGDEHQKALKFLQVGAGWTRQYLYHIGEEKEPFCDICGGEVMHTAAHVLWECPVHEELRRENVAPIDTLN